MENEALEKITDLYKSYLKKNIEMHNFRMYNIFTSLIIDELEESQIMSILDALDEPAARFAQYKKLTNELQEQNRKYESVNSDVAYKIYFQNFEEFLSETMYWCMYYFPKYIINDESKSEIFLEKIFSDNSTIDDLKDHILSFRVKRIMQSTNIVDAVLKFERLFSFKFELSKNTLDDLYVASLNRNLLTHNSGIVNDIYLNLLAAKKISCKFKKGDNLLDEYIEKSLGNHSNSLSDLVEKMFKIIAKDLKRLKQHHDKMI